MTVEQLLEIERVRKGEAPCPDPVPIHGPNGELYQILEYVNGSWAVTHDFRDQFDSPPLPREARKSTVYFIGDVEGGPIKIGQTMNLLERLRDIQNGNPFRLAILATCKGGVAQERDYHRRFAAHRLHGEWFARVPEIEAEIARLHPPTTDYKR